MIEGRIAVFTQFKECKLWWHFRNAWRMLYHDITNHGRLFRITITFNPKEMVVNRMYRVSYLISRDEDKSPVSIRLYNQKIERVEDEK